MSYQDPNQASFGAAQQGQQPGWGQQSQQQGTWGQPGASGQTSGQSWGAPQGQIPQQPNYPGAPGYGQPGAFGQPQDSVAGRQQYGQQPGYFPQTDFGSGGYGQGYPTGQQNSTLATWSLWLGILGGWGLINLVISILAINETGPGKKLGRNKAITGLILTFVWAAIWIGLTLAITSHAKAVIASDTTLPSAVATSTVGVQAQGASSDSGCQAAQSAFNTYQSTITANSSNGITAMETLGNALQTAGGQSTVAGSQLKALGNDFLELSNSTTPSSMVSDMQAVNSACGMTFTFTG
jgi:hypothetical protein